MRIGFHYHVDAWQQPDGPLLVPPYLGRFMDELARYYDGITAFLHRHPVGLAPSAHIYACQAANLDLSLLPPKKHPARRLLASQEYMKAVFPFHGQLDALILRVPTPLGWSIWRTLGYPPTGLLVVGDMIESIRRGPLPLHKKLLYLALFYLDLQRLQQVARNAVVVTNGPELAAKWQRRVGDVMEVATGTLYASELRERDDHFQGPSIHLLFVGRNSREKRVEDLIEAAALLANDTDSIVVDLAGIERDSPYGRDLAALASARGIGDAICFHGFVQLEPDLLGLYDQADVMVIPSRWEGIPRVLWEAMGRGCLVVTTAVGGIPMVTRHGRECLHVSVGWPDMIAEAVLQLRRGAGLRRQLVAAGIEQARRHTIEYTVAHLVEILGCVDSRLASSRRDGSENGSDVCG